MSLINSRLPERTLAWLPKGLGCDALRSPRAGEIHGHASGHLPPVSSLRRQFCERLAGARVLLIGDSVQGQFFTSLSHVIGFTSSVKETCVGKVSLPHRIVPRVMTVHACPDHAGVPQTRIRFVRSDFLRHDNSSQPWRTAWWSECEWGLAEVERSDVVIVSRGAHYVPDRLFVPELDATLSAIARIPKRTPSGRQRLVIFRGSHMPVPGCDPSLVPLAVPLTAAGLARSKRAAMYHWPYFAHQNELARCLARNYGIIFLDVYFMMSFRQDAALSKMDCVHSCLPGPVDEWTRLLLAFLAAALPPSR
ncbi:hypothetical protein T492DRAFT_1052697 [Pavlovales sp. CCMP2436]|nr:hypothetical protein T492DRAFT_1052697 [Pavlovales sp. CCMP2436]